MAKEIYKLDVVCTNCGTEQTVEIPQGEEWHNVRFGGASKHGFANIVYCTNCKCATLKRKIAKKDGS